MTRQYESIGEIRVALRYQCEDAIDDLLARALGAEAGRPAVITLHLTADLVQQIKDLERPHA